MSGDVERININAVALKELGHTGIRRAVLFMGLALNAAHRPDFNDYQLHKVPRVPGHTGFPIEFFPDDLPNERVQDIKTEFATWAVGCGLREIIESYALMLDQMHLFALVVLQSQGKLQRDVNPQNLHRDFEGRGVPGKMRRLKELAGITVRDEECVGEIYNVRNALTHDLGLVTEKRAPSGTLSVSWKAFDFMAVGIESGIERPMSELFGVRTTEETNLLARVVQRERKYAVGETIRLSHQDVFEVCWFFNAIVLESTVASFIQFVRDHGIPEADATA